MKKPQNLKKDIRIISGNDNLHDNVEMHKLAKFIVFSFAQRNSSNFISNI